jgi:hypothetical protein
VPNQFVGHRETYRCALRQTGSSLLTL